MSPLENADLLDPFYNKSEALIEILNKNGYTVPNDYLNNLSYNGSYTGDKLFDVSNIEYNNSSTTKKAETARQIIEIPMKV